MPANYVLLQRIALTQDAASVTLSRIPSSGYTDLKLVVSARGTYSGNAIATKLLPQGSTSNMTSRVMYGDGTAQGTFSDTIAYGSIPAATATANTYGNLEYYIFNYLSGNAKGILSDGVTEHQGTTSLSVFGAARWNDATAISSLQFMATTGNLVAGSQFSLYGLAAVGTTPAISPFATGGNVIVNDGTYWYHAFLSSGTFTPFKALSCDYLVVAGGGGGGGHNAGGGGAGGLRSTVTATGGGGSLESPLSLTAQAYGVTVGGGGNGGGNFRGTSGVDSSFATITSTGGGGGGGGNGTGVAQTGGSGGGGVVGQNGGTGTANQGFAGGSAVSGGNAGAGGGGAGSLGGTTTNSNGGSGGNGVTISAFATPTNTGVSGVYAGGGGGSSFSGSQGAAGTGGASAGQYDTAANATANTGSGAGARNREPTAAGNGGSGIVIVRYLMSS